MIARGLLSTELFWTCLIWLLIFIIGGILIWGVYRENHRIKFLLRGENHHPSAIASVIRTISQRHMHLWIFVMLLAVIAAANDIRREIISSHTAAVITPAQTIAPTAKTLVHSPVENTQSNTLPPSIFPFSGVTEFDEKDSKQQAYFDTLKQRYEAWLITYYYLQKCGKVEAEDFEIIHSSLRKALGTSDAGGTIENNILIAANGSYNEMYHEVPCDSDYLTASKSTYDANMQQLRHKKN